MDDAPIGGQAQPARPGGPDVAESGSPRYHLLHAGRLIQQGRGKEAISVLESLGTLAPGPEITRLRYLAIAHNNAGDFRRSLELLKSAQQLAESDGKPEDPVYILAATAGALEKSGNDEAAIDCILRALKGCEEGIVLDDVLHMRLLEDLAGIYTRQGRLPEAARMIDEGLVMAERYADARARAQYYVEVGARFHERGDLANANFYNQKAVHVSEEIRVLDRIAQFRQTATRFKAENTKQQP